MIAGDVFKLYLYILVECTRTVTYISVYAEPAEVSDRRLELQLEIVALAAALQLAQYDLIPQRIVRLFRLIERLQPQLYLGPANGRCRRCYWTARGTLTLHARHVAAAQ